ncbi:alpha/beta fold hydrolase [Streptomyces sp. NPDC088354]|uniref:alpha/beta fold hydrolase n=1 Tax=Streptomyces sp. NPDC088354 TaxID=3365856 RepID=UPI0038299C5A
MDRPSTGAVASVPTRLGPLGVETVGSGPPVLLWHSLFVDSTTWVRVRQPLAATRRLVIVDGPAHGRSAAPRHPFTLDDCAGAALDVLEHLGIDEPVDWAGNAWGGHVGITFAAAHPRRLRSLATIGAPVHALTAPERRQINLLVPLYRAVGPIRPVLGALTTALLGAAADPEAITLVAEAFSAPERGGMARAIRSASLDRQDLTPTLTSVPAPTLFAAGAEDTAWTPDDAAAAAARLPRGGWAVLPGAGHVAPLLEAAPAVVDLLTAFWRDPDAVGALHRDSGARSGPQQPQSTS